MLSLEGLKSYFLDAILNKALKKEKNYEYS